MAWFDEILTALGFVGSTGIAAAVYRGSVALNKKINPERRKDLTHFLTVSADRVKAPNTGKMILSMFEAVFGRHHFSWTCVSRSVLLTVLTIILLTALVEYRIGDYTATIYIGGETNTIKYSDFFFTLRTLGIIAAIAFISVIPDYISLLKGRLLLHLMARFASIWVIIVATVVDIVGSIFVSIFGVAFVFLIAATFMNSTNSSAFRFGLWLITQGAEGLALGVYQSLFQRQHDPTSAIFIFAFSTLFTSVWTIMVGLSLIVVRALLPLRYLAFVTRYLFNVEESPVEAVGIVLAVATWLCSLAATLL